MTLLDKSDLNQGQTPEVPLFRICFWISQYSKNQIDKAFTGRDFVTANRALALFLSNLIVGAGKARPTEPGEPSLSVAAGMWCLDIFLVNPGL
jgi:hypothetical protein